MKTKLLIAGIAISGLGLMHMGKVRVCPLGLMIHGLHKNTASKPVAKAPLATTATVVAESK